MKHKELFKKYIAFENMILITPNCSNDLKEINNVVLINEDQLVPKDNLIKILNKRGIKEINRTGWYEQQFLKMSYSRICQKEY